MRTYHEIMRRDTFLGSFEAMDGAGAAYQAQLLFGHKGTLVVSLHSPEELEQNDAVEKV